MWLLTDESSGKWGHFPSSLTVWWMYIFPSSVFLLSVLGHIPMCPISYKGFPVCRTEEEAVVGRFFAPLGVPGCLRPARWECGVWRSGNSLGAVGFLLCFSGVAELAAGVPKVVGVRRELDPFSSAGNHSNLTKGTAQSRLRTEGFISCSI